MSNADEILKYKQLYDAGAISSAEFEAQKARILSQPTNRYSAAEDDWAEIESEYKTPQNTGASSSSPSFDAAPTQPAYQSPAPGYANPYGNPASYQAAQPQTMNPYTQGTPLISVPGQVPNPYTTAQPQAPGQVPNPYAAPAQNTYTAPVQNPYTAPGMQAAPQNPYGQALSQQAQPQSPYTVPQPQAQQPMYQQPGAPAPAAYAAQAPQPQPTPAPAVAPYAAPSQAVQPYEEDSEVEGYTDEELYDDKEEVTSPKKSKASKKAKETQRGTKASSQKNKRKNKKADSDSRSGRDYDEVDAEDQEYDKINRGDVFGILAIIAGLFGFYLHVIPGVVGIILGIIGLFRDRSRWVALFGILVSAVVMAYPILNPTPIAQPAAQTQVETTEQTTTVDENGNPIDATETAATAQTPAATDQSTSDAATTATQTTEAANAMKTASTASTKSAEDVAETRKKADEYVEAMETVLKQQYGDQYTIVGDETGCLITFWKDGLGEAADQASDGDESTKEVWKQLKDNIQSLSETAYDQYCSSVNEDGHVMLNLVDDRDHDNILLMFEDGKCHIDVVGTR